MKVIYDIKFKKELKRISKKTPLIHNDIDNFLENIQNNGIKKTPNLINIHENKLFKTRIKCQGTNKGKSSGLRIAFAFEIKDDKIILLLIWKHGLTKEPSSKEIKETYTNYLKNEE